MYGLAGELFVSSRFGGTCLCVEVGFFMATGDAENVCGGEKKQDYFGEERCVIIAY